MVENNLDKLVGILRKLNYVQTQKITCDNINYFYLIDGNKYSLTLWDKKVNDRRLDLILGTLRVKFPRNGIGTYVLNSLKEHGNNIGYSRLVVNKAENILFLEKNDFMPHEIDPLDYYSILK